MKVSKPVLTDMKHIRGEGHVPESGKSNREMESLTDISSSQVSAIIKRFKDKKPLEGGKSTDRLRKMTRRPLQALVDSVKVTPFKPIKGHQNVVNAIGYDFSWKKYINEADFFSRIPAVRPTLTPCRIEKKLAWAK
jgi:hypothetical protein